MDLDIELSLRAIPGHCQRKIFNVQELNPRVASFNNSIEMSDLQSPVPRTRMLQSDAFDTIIAWLHSRISWAHSDTKGIFEGHYTWSKTVESSTKNNGATRLSSRQRIAANSRVGNGLQSLISKFKGKTERLT